MRPGAVTRFEHFLRARASAVHRRRRRHSGSCERQANALVADVPEIMVMEEMHPPRQTHLLKRGAYDAPGDIVERNTPASLPPFPADQPRNRLGLARWLTSPQHPLAARVVVNRVWRMHFGRGIVATPEDFGSQGKLPTHPELLDWLTDRFMKDGWDLKVAAPAHRALGDVPPVLRHDRRRGGARSGKPAAVPMAEDAAAGGTDSRQRARRQRAAESDHRRAERQAVSARRAVGAIRDRQDLQAGHRAEALSPQPLHVLEEDRAAAVDDRVRRRHPRGLRGQTRSDA